MSTRPTDPRVANHGPVYLSYTDPSSRSLQHRLGISQRAIVNTCKREGWPWRKVYGRIWVCADFADRYEAKYGKL